MQFGAHYISLNFSLWELLPKILKSYEVWLWETWLAFCQLKETISRRADKDLSLTANLLFHWWFMGSVLFVYVLSQISVLVSGVHDLETQTCVWPNMDKFA